MARNESLEALERSIPKIFEVDNKIKVTSSMLPEVKGWVTGEDYTLSNVVMTQLASRELKNGEIESEFEIKKITAENTEHNSAHKD